MKNKLNRNAFTLIELLATIVVIALVATIATITITGVIKGAKNDTKTISKAEFQKAMEIYIIQNRNEIIQSMGSNTSTIITEAELQEKGYIGGKVSIDEDDDAVSIYSWKVNLIDGQLTLSEEEPIKTTSKYLNLIVKNDSNIETIEDGDNTSYYYHGANPNNFIKIKNGSNWLTFRIIRLAGDGSVRLLYNNDENGITTLADKSDLFSKLTAYMSPGGKFYAITDKIMTVNYCNKIYSTSPQNKSDVNFNCNASYINNNNINLMSLEEFVLSNDGTNTDVKSYAINGCTSSQSINRCPRMFLGSYSADNPTLYMYMYYNSKINYRNITNTSEVIRPVISISGNTVITGGNGTQYNPYVVE